jgi:uncharacterized membrane protein
MPKTYNRFAGRSLERLAAPNDGIFAFSMTLLVLDIPMPPLFSVHNEGGLASALAALFPRVVTWLTSLMTLPG